MESPIVRKVLFGRDCTEDWLGRVFRRKIRQLDLTIETDCIVNYVYASINAASQEVFSTCANRLVCCDVTMHIYIYIYVGIHATSQEVFSRTRGVRINHIIKRYCVLL